MWVHAVLELLLCVFFASGFYQFVTKLVYDDIGKVDCGGHSIRVQPNALNGCHRIYSYIDWVQFRTNPKLSPPAKTFLAVGSYIDYFTDLSETFSVLSEEPQLTPTIIHIGPRERSCELQLMSICLDSGVFPQGRVVLVEPNAAALPKLRENVYGVGYVNHDIIHAAVCPETADNVPFYQFAASLREAFPELKTTFTELSSLDKDMLINGHASNFDRFDKNPGYAKEDWLRMMDHVEKTLVRCISPRTLLREWKIVPESVVVLIIDARGYNHELLGQFKALNVNPQVVQFEWDAASNIRDASDPDKAEEFLKRNVTALVDGFESELGFKARTYDQDLLLASKMSKSTTCVKEQCNTCRSGGQCNALFPP